MNLKETLLNDAIEIEILPSKKGLIKKHIEYNVSSARFKSQVCRRYSDFTTFHELLIQRFPYRLIPKLPPQKISALFNGVDSDFAESRRKALKRWMVLLYIHPILKDESMLKYFLTYMGDDLSTKMKDEFKTLPDEFITREDTHESRSNLTPSILNYISEGRGQITVISEITSKVINILDKIVSHSNAMSEIMGDLSQEINNVTNESYLGGGSITTQNWNSMQNSFIGTTQNLNHATSQWKSISTNEELEVKEILKLFEDSLIGYKEMCDRIDKNLIADNKRAVEKMANIKKKKLQGILNSDPTMASQLESRIDEHEIIFGDLESRQAFSSLCMAHENDLVFVLTELLANAVCKLSVVEIQGFRDLMTVWTQIQINLKNFNIEEFDLK